MDVVGATLMDLTFKNSTSQSCSNIIRAKANATRCCYRRVKARADGLVHRAYNTVGKYNVSIGSLIEGCDFHTTVSASGGVTLWMGNSDADPDDDPLDMTRMLVVRATTIEHSGIEWAVRGMASYVAFNDCFVNHPDSAKPCGGFRSGWNCWIDGSEFKNETLKDSAVSVLTMHDADTVDTP